MQEYNDGSFGEIQESSELLRNLKTEELEHTKKIHFGTVQELEQIKLHGNNAKRIMSKLEQLERKINRIIIHLNIETPGEILVVD